MGKSRPVTKDTILGTGWGFGSGFGSPLGLLIIVFFIVYIGSRSLRGKKDLYGNFDIVLIATFIGGLLFLYTFPNTKIAQATNQYYTQRAENRRQFWNTLTN